MTKTKKAYIPSKIELEGLLSITKEDSIQRWAMLHFSYFAGLRSMEIASLSIEDHSTAKENFLFIILLTPNCIPFGL